MPQPNTQPSQITPELHATLNAWRELGPDYDDQFITAVVAVNLIFGLPEVTRRPARRTRR